MNLVLNNKRKGNSNCLKESEKRKKKESKQVRDEKGKTIDLRVGCWWSQTGLRLGLCRKKKFTITTTI